MTPDYCSGTISYVGVLPGLGYPARLKNSVITVMNVILLWRFPGIRRLIYHPGASSSHSLKGFSVCSQGSYAPHTTKNSQGSPGIGFYGFCILNVLCTWQN